MQRLGAGVANNCSSNSSRKKRFGLQPSSNSCRILFCTQTAVGMTSFIERKVNEICGRWLDGFTKDNVDVSLLQAKITLSDLHFKTVSMSNDCLRKK